MEVLKISSNGQWTLENDLNKGSLIAAAIAGMLSQSPIDIPYAPKSAAQQSQTLHPDLEHIAFIESSSGKNKKHKTVNYGLNRGDTAAGLTGLMPITVKEIINKNPDMKTKYGELMNSDHNKITSYINSNENADIELSNKHWNRLSRVFPRDELRRVYAWKNGVTGAIKASDEQVAQHPYVRKYIDLKYQQKAPERAPASTISTPKLP